MLSSRIYLPSECPANLLINQTQLTPFVTNKIEPMKGRYEGYALGPKSPELYLDRWKAENGLD